VEKLLHACTRSREIKSQSKAIILKGDCEATHTKQYPASEGSPSNFSALAAIGAVVAWSLAALSLLAVRSIEPPSTAVHIGRRLQAWLHQRPYRKRYRFIPLAKSRPICSMLPSPRKHHAFDWHQIQIAAEDSYGGGRTRGASTISQQLVKNLFFGTGRSLLRKGAECEQRGSRFLHPFIGRLLTKS
jgi:monofunctional glycosyltransferase